MTARKEEAEGKISETEVKVMEKEEAVKERNKKIGAHEGIIREISNSKKRSNSPYYQSSGGRGRD